MQPEKKSHGALIGSLIIVLILVIGGIYVFQNKMKTIKENNLAQEKANLEQQKAISANETGEINNLDNEINTTDSSTGVDASKIQ